jgi:hypothetical protein
MADTKISALTAASAAAGTNEIPINEAGTTKKITLTQAGLLLDSRFNAPQGFLINGKIVVTDAAGITVAIKGLDGNDPSATNPVYCRIGDTVRAITSALSVAKADGTNWFNAGSAELATKEIDYFVYLGYNATDGVVIGFSRIPYANSYDDFSATTTNEKYCAISTISNAAATDYYENIGRFAATLSAGAGYTWTVPTFTAKNLIQRPIYETRVADWQPVYTGSESLTYTSVDTRRAKYKIVGKNLNVWFYAVGTTGGTTNTEIRVTLPITVSFQNRHPVIFIDASNTTSYIGISLTAATTYMGFCSYVAGDIGLGAGREIGYEGTYQL